MNDFELLTELSGEAGSLGQLTALCGKLNDTLVKMTDSMFGPDGTDTFDASCNTCKYFQRSPMSPSQKAERNIFGMPGFCALKQSPTVAWQRGQYCSLENGSCYQNRRTGLAPKDLTWRAA